MTASYRRSGSAGRATVQAVHELLLRRRDQAGHVNFLQKEVAAELGITPPQMSRAVARLRSDGRLVRNADGSCSVFAEADIDRALAAEKLRTARSSATQRLLLEIRDLLLEQRSARATVVSTVQASEITPPPPVSPAPPPASVGDQIEEEPAPAIPEPQGPLRPLASGAGGVPQDWPREWPAGTYACDDQGVIFYHRGGTPLPLPRGIRPDPLLATLLRAADGRPVTPAQLSARLREYARVPAPKWQSYLSRLQGRQD